MEAFISTHIVKIVLALEVVLGALILRFVPCKCRFKPETTHEGQTLW